MVICLERDADLYMAQLMPLPLTVFCLCKIQIAFTFLVSSHPDSPGQGAVERACVIIDMLKLSEARLLTSYVDDSSGAEKVVKRTSVGSPRGKEVA